METAAADYHLTVNERHTFGVNAETAQQLDVVPNGPQQYHIVQGNKAWHVEVVHMDTNEHTYTLRVDGRLFKVNLADQYGQLIKQMGLTLGGATKMNALKAPMPGLVLQVAVQPGQTVKKGDTLLILEAMKMENVLKAAGEGVIKTVYVQKGDTIDKGKLLLDLE